MNVTASLCNIVLMLAPVRCSGHMLLQWWPLVVGDRRSVLGPGVTGGVVSWCQQEALPGHTIPKHRAWHTQVHGAVQVLVLRSVLCLSWYHTAGNPWQCPRPCPRSARAESCCRVRAVVNGWCPDHSCATLRFYWQSEDTQNTTWSSDQIGG